MTARLPTPRTVLVARSPERARGLIGRLRDAGIDALAAPVIERAPVEDPAGVADLTAARAALARGDYAWVAVTSVNAVDALLGSPDADRAAPGSGPARGAVAALPRGLPDAPEAASPAPPSDDEANPPVTRWACVGPATRQAIEAHALTVDLTPADHMTATGLVTAFPAAPTPGVSERDHAVLTDGRAPTARHDVAGDGPDGTPDGLVRRRVLVPLGDLAAATLPEGLRAKGWEPHVVVAYRTVARELPRDVVERAKAPGYDVVVVASGSAAREVAAQLGPQRVVAIGEPSARAARDAGHDVAAVAAAPTDGALATAVVHALGDGLRLAPGEPPDPATLPGTARRATPSDNPDHHEGVTP